jgi:hypothetical protein
MRFKLVGEDQNTKKEWDAVARVEFEGKTLSLFGGGDILLASVTLEPGEFVWGMEMPHGPEFVALSFREEPPKLHDNLPTGAY